MDNTAPQVFSFKYDKADQLLRATLKSTVDNSLLTDLGYHYDPAGNRLSESMGSITNQATYNPIKGPSLWG